MTTFADAHMHPSVPAAHIRFGGALVDIGNLSAEELSTLWPLLQSTLLNPASAHGIREEAGRIMRVAAQRALVPRLDSPAMLATLRTVLPEHTSVEWLLDQASYLDGMPDPALELELEGLLPHREEWIPARHALLAVGRALGAVDTTARLAQAVKECFGDTLPAREFDVLGAASLPAVFAIAREGYHGPRVIDPRRESDPVATLAADAKYAAFAREALEEAERLIDAGSSPHHVGGNWDLEAMSVLGRAARVAAMRDESWCPELVARLLPGASFASSAGAATAQAPTIAVDDAVAREPASGTAAAPRRVLNVVRPAGQQNQPSRTHMKPAEHAPPRQLPMALQPLQSDIDPQRRHALLTRFFESSLAVPIELSYGQWRARLLSDDVAASCARALIWHAGAAFMLDDRDQPVDARGRPLDVADDSPVILWHPVESDEEERAAWRTRLVRKQLRQPVRQAFRTFYQPAGSAIFADYKPAGAHLLRQARDEGWVIGDCVLERRYGDFRAEFGLGARLYPGFDGVVDSGLLDFFDGADWIPLFAVPPRVVSEACRAVSLLVSAAVVATKAQEACWSQARSEVLWRLAG